MWYAIISEDVDNSPGKRQQAKPAHLERLGATKKPGGNGCRDHIRR